MTTASVLTAPLSAATFPHENVSVEKPQPQRLSREVSVTELTQVTAITEDGTHMMCSSSSDSEGDDDDDSEVRPATVTPERTEDAAAVSVDTPLDALAAAAVPSPTTSSPNASFVEKRRRSSIKPYNAADIPIVNKSWKTLPKVNLERLRSVDASTASEEDLQIQRPKHVVFDQIHMRNYSQCIGDNPSVSYGPPIQLDWEYEDLEAIAVDDYEVARAPRRTLRQLMLNYYARRNILTYCCGASEADLEQATNSANRVKCQRSLTRALKPLYLVEAACESVARKTKRRFGRKR